MKNTNASSNSTTTPVTLTNLLNDPDAIANILTNEYSVEPLKAITKHKTQNFGYVYYRKDKNPNGYLLTGKAL